MSGEACSPWCGYCGACTSGVAPNAACPGCGQDFYKAPADIGDLCDDCCVLRDALQEGLRTIGLQAVKRALARTQEVA